MDRATIINSMLSVIGESGVSASTSTHPSVQTASRILDAEDLDFQQAGWWFNREYKLTLVQDADGRVAVPAAALECSISNIQCKLPVEKLRYTRRGNFIYDTYKHTNVIERSLDVDLIVRLSIDALPSAAASYILHKARETMYIDDDGDTFKTQILQQETVKAWARLQAVKLRIEATNALDTPYAQTLLSGMGSGVTRNPNLIGGRFV